MGAVQETITVEGTPPLLSPDEASTETRYSTTKSSACR